jgi:ABC-type transport system involved in Fe-S cluster assembly fused permease/ATPase subunit
VPWCQIFLYVLYGWLNSSAGIYALKNYLWLPVEQYAYKAISTAAYNHIMNLSSEFHDSKRSGELYQSINLGHSVNNLLETIMFQILPMLVDLAVAFAYLYYLFDAYMALIVGAVMVVYLWASTYFNAWQITVRRGLVGNLQKVADNVRLDG